jgi:hypothetical protein
MVLEHHCQSEPVEDLQKKTLRQAQCDICFGMYSKHTIVSLSLSKTFKKRHFDKLSATFVSECVVSIPLSV